MGHFHLIIPARECSDFLYLKVGTRTRDESCSLREESAGQTIRNYCCGATLHHRSSQRHSWQARMKPVWNGSDRLDRQWSPARKIDASRLRSRRAGAAGVATTVELAGHRSIAYNSVAVTDGKTCCTLRDLATAAAPASGRLAAVRPFNIYLYARAIFKGIASAGPASRHKYPDRLSVRQP